MRVLHIQDLKIYFPLFAHPMVEFKERKLFPLPLCFLCYFEAIILGYNICNPCHTLFLFVAFSYRLLVDEIGKNLDYPKGEWEMANIHSIT